ncbi:hypothetical protein, partial [Lactobacillus crispatus]|uniref:hypothetical protein n=1 Tax=Lactobacillus crispatus TaxID=47770 RepID=UPI00105B34B1
WLKGRFLLLKILKRTKKRSRFLKKEILIVFIHLEASFFPDTFVIINYYLLTSSLKLLPGLNAGTFDAAISISLPVCGLRPLRAAR